MAEDGEVDLSALSDSQQEALQQYTMITDQDVKDAVPVLQRSQWNAQVCCDWPISNSGRGSGRGAGPLTMNATL